MLGKTVGKYRVLERLGRGGMGIVYKALDETLDREVAIKVLNPDLGDAELLKRFRAEAISLARLNHSGIATIYELHRHDDDLLMVMEFVRGETLQSLSERLGPLEPPQAAHVCIQILDALAHAHRAGVIHRDLKPANVMITDTGTVKVMDFGIARMLGAEHFTHAGYMMGTPAYMAPEQVLGEAIDGRADIYSVGVVFYRLLSRQLPFQADTAISMAQKQVTEPPTPIRTFRPELPAWCQSIIAKALSKAPADRFQTAEAFRSALREAVTPLAMGELPTMATPTSATLLRTGDLTLPNLRDPSTAPTMTLEVPSAGATAPSGSPVAPTPGASAPGTTGTSPIERTGTTVVLGRTHLITLAALLVVLMAGIAALGYAALRRSDAQSQTVALAPVDPVSGGAEGQPDQSQPPVPVSEPPSADAPPPAPPPPPAAAVATTSPSSNEAVPTPARKAKPAQGAPEVVAPTEPRPAPRDLSPPGEVPPAPEFAPVTVSFKDVKILVPQGDTMRDRDAVLRLDGDRLTVLDRAGQAEILSLPYASVVHVFYSRSKQPRWKGPDGKESEASVDRGKLSFFRGERNWLILTTQAEPVFLRFEDAALKVVLPAVEERTGLKIQR
jgi:serine/threonine-protein kinase